ncbi:MAG: response regulator [Prevotella sp.]|jgi:signal transduction histidine kinase/ligand-binding sensor domain-containing protein/DNA-binding response OmpR family regulator|nr:response regulator [Prevotella sp.]
MYSSKVKYFCYIFFVLATYCVSQSVYAKDEYKFRTLSPAGGFYYDGVKQIQQDKEGFIWILMDNDLYRFDGYQYKQYYTYFTDLDKSVEWVFINMAADLSDRFFVNTNNGLYSYNKATDTFYKVLEEKPSAISIDNRNIVWGRIDNSWNILDISNHGLYKPLYDGKSINYISSVFCAYNNDLYVFSNYGKLYRFNYSKKEFNLCFTMPDRNAYISGALIYKGKMWVLSQGKDLYRIDLTTFTIEEHIEAFKEKAAVRNFYIDKNGDIWLGTITGLYIYHPDTKKTTHYMSSKSNPFSLPNNSIWTINEDWQKNIWIGTFSGGLCYVNLDEKIPFETYLPKEGYLSSAPVSAFAEDKDNLWIGTEGGGLNRVDKQTGKFTYYTTGSGDNSIAYNNIKSLVVDKNQNLWISMFNGGLDFYDLKSNRIQNFKHDKDKNSLLDNNIRKVVQEADAGIWIAYQRQKLVISYYSFDSKRFSHFNIGEDGQYIFDIVRGRENQLWILSSKNLYLMDVKDHSVKKIERKTPDFLNFQAFCLDDSGNLWIGTIGNGLVKYNPKTSEFVLFKELLKNNVDIYSICHDDEGNLWMGTNNGLVKYNIAGNTFSKYNKKDGTQGQVYYPLASMKGSGGELYFGGTNGFTVVNSKDITWNQYKPKVIISDFMIDNKSTKFIMGDSLSNEMVLDYDQINFGFRFSSDNYLNPEKNHFKYRLRGYDDRWIEVDASNRTALYSKIPAGTYYFEVLASNNDGVWSDVPTIVKIKRKPAPWFSWYAYLFYSIAALTITCLILRYYNEKKKLKMQLYLESVEKEKKEQIHNAQLRFFTGISHDFRTPLSLIIAAIDRLRQEGLKEYYYRILNNNSRRLLNLVNELMDFRTIENGKMKLAIEPVNANAYIEDLASDFIDYAKQRDIDLRIQCDSALPAEIYLDKHIVERCIINLLHNAFKYTKQGSISIETCAHADNFSPRYANNYTVQGEGFPDNAFAIVVRDTGVGIEKSSIATVFERFYTVNAVNTDTHLGTGLGLALVKSLVLLHKGAISIYSEPDKGTDMVIYLSLDKEIYGEKDFMEIKDVPVEKFIDAEAVKEEVAELRLEDDILLRDKKRILFAEDNEDLRALITDALSDDYEVVEAPDGMFASQILNSMAIDLVISDIMMPLKDGVTLCYEVKNDINTSHIPFILLTAKTSIESKIEGVDSGADIYFEKPIDISFLRLSIQNIFKHQQQLKEYYAKNYFVDSAELSSNEHDNKFLKKFIEILEANLDQSEMDVNYIASKLSMSRSKLYTKIKTLTDKSIVEFILSYRLRKAARLIIEEDMTMREVMSQIGIESQPYFTNAFKKEFGETPTSFAAKHKKKTK